MTVIATIVGLTCAMVAFGIAVRGFYKMVDKHKAQPTIPDAKFFIIRNVLLSLVISTGMLFATVVGTSIVSYLKARETNNSLCALRNDLEVRVADSKDFLEENPNGIPGISTKVILDGISNQERTIEALSNLSC